MPDTIPFTLRSWTPATFITGLRLLLFADTISHTSATTFFSLISHPTWSIPTILTDAYNDLAILDFSFLFGSVSGYSTLGVSARGFANLQRSDLLRMFVLFPFLLVLRYLFRAT